MMFNKFNNEGIKNYWGTKNMDERKSSPRWTDIVVAFTSIVTVVAIISEKNYATTFAYILIVLVAILLLRNWVKKKYFTYKLLLKEKNTIKHFSSKFNLLVSNASELMQSTQTHSIPYYLRSYLGNPELRHLKPSENIESLFSTLSRRLQSRIKNGYKTFSDFEEVNHDLHDYLDAYGRIYVSAFIRTLKETEKIALMSESEKTELNSRIELFRKYIHDFNAYRKEISIYFNGEEPKYILQIPTDSIY